MRRWPLAACVVVLLGLYAVPVSPYACMRWEPESASHGDPETMVLWRWSTEVRGWEFWLGGDNQGRVAIWSPVVVAVALLTSLLIRRGAAANWVSAVGGSALLLSVMYFSRYYQAVDMEPLDWWMRMGWPVLVPLTICFTAGGFRAAGRTVGSLAIVPLLPSLLLLAHALVFLVAPAALAPGTLVQEVMHSQIPNRPASAGGLLRLAVAMTTVGAGIAGLIYAVGRQRIFARTGWVLSLLALASVLLLDGLYGYREIFRETRCLEYQPHWQTGVNLAMLKLHKLLPAAVGMLLVIMGTSRLWIGYRLRQLTAGGTATA